MDFSAGPNPLVMLLTFLSGLGFTSFTNLLTSLLSAVLVGLIGLAANTWLKRWSAERNNFWRKRAKKLAEEKRQLEARLREQENDAPQLPG